MYILITAFFLAVTIIEFIVKGFIKKKYWMEAAVYIFIMSIALIYSYGAFGDMSLPNPTGFLEIIFKPVSNYFYGEPIK